MYSISINGGEPFQVETGENGRGLFNQKEFHLDIVSTGAGSYHVIRDNKSYRIEVVRIEREEKRLVFKINGDRYEAGLKDKFDLLVESMGLKAGGSGKVKEFKAPMPGLVLDIFTKEGERVAKGDPLVVLEAMKMENMLKSPGDGVVKKILIKTRQPVEKNQVLISFE